MATLIEWRHCPMVIARPRGDAVEHVNVRAPYQPKAFKPLPGELKHAKPSECASERVL
jgi:hypothetical protein